MTRQVATTRRAARGTLRRDRIGSAIATRLERVPPPPHGLSAAARTWWRRLVRTGMELGTITRADLPALQMLAETMAGCDDLRAAIAREGLTVAAGGGGRKAHPALRALQSARAHALQLLAAFGMTPAGRRGVDLAPSATQGGRERGHHGLPTLDDIERALET